MDFVILGLKSADLRLKMGICLETRDFIVYNSREHLVGMRFAWGSKLMPVFMTDRKSGEKYALDKAIVLIGRHPDCDIVLGESPKVSRRHCCIAQVNDIFIVRDLGSMNGVRVNNELIRKESQLKRGDELAVGDVRFVIEFVESAKNGSKIPADSVGVEQKLAEVAEKPEKKNGSVSSPSDSRKSAGQSKKPVRQLNLSQSIPIALEEEDRDFAVEDRILEKSSLGLKPQDEQDKSLNDVVVVEDVSPEEPDETDESSI